MRISCGAAVQRDEQTAWQPMLRPAPLRFWLSRLLRLYLPREAEMLTRTTPAISSGFFGNVWPIRTKPD